MNSVSHNEDASVCASGSLDSTVALWDLKSRSSTRPIQRLTEFRDSVTQVKIKGTQIVASSLDGYVRVYDVRMGRLSEIKVGQPINSFDVKDTFVGCSCIDSTSRIVDMSDGQIVAEYSGSHTSTKYHSSIKFTHMGDWLVQASEDNSIAAYSVHSPQTVKHLNGHTMPVISIDIADQGLLVSGSADGTIKTWNFN